MTGNNPKITADKPSSPNTPNALEQSNPLPLYQQNTTNNSQVTMDNGNTNHIAHVSFLAGFLGTLASVFKDKGVVLMLMIAPIIYGFFYPWPYQGEVVLDIPVGIVDNDNSRLSQTIVRYSQSSPELEVHLYHTQADARQAIYKGDITGYLLIPTDLEKHVYASKPTYVSIMGNNSYFLMNKNLQVGFTKAVGTVSAGIEVKRSVAKGVYMDTAKVSTQAVPLRIDPMFNRTEGYGAYVVPAVAILILQQTLLMGTALLIGTWYERRQQNASISGWAGRILALSLISFLVGCFYYGWVFSIQDYPRGHNMIGTLVFFALFAPTVATLGCVLGMWFRQRERSLQILVFSAMPMFFVSGYPWPVSQLPLPLQYLRWIFPSSSGIHASVQLNQMGASLAQVSGSLYHLLALWVCAFVALIFIQRRQLRLVHHPHSYIKPKL